MEKENSFNPLSLPEAASSDTPVSLSRIIGNANEEQLEAIKTTEGPLLIIAGPGTGKTFTLVKRIAYLIIEKGVAPEEIMVATFTEKAAKELITRVTNELLEAGIHLNLNEMYIGTFHHICLRIIKEHQEFTRLKKNYQSLDDYDQKYIIAKHIAEFKQIPDIETLIPRSGGKWNFAAQIAKRVSGLAEELVDVNAMAEDPDCRMRCLAAVMQKYEQILTEENAIDFSGMQSVAYGLLKDYPDILADIQFKIRYIMVDEYQDTNYIQEQLIFLIAGSRKNICVVGDDDQGLYRFRGATIRNILEFPEKFDGDCKQVFLSKNYRSEEDIVRFCTNWMQPTNGQFEWDNFRYPKSITPDKNVLADTVTVVRCNGKKTEEDWFNNVYELIVSLKQSGRISDYNQIAFLCRSVKNKEILKLIHYLEKRNIPVYSPRSDMFFERAAVRIALGCILRCFPDYVQKLNASLHANKYDRYLKECIVKADKSIEKHPDLKAWVEARSEDHSNLKKNTDYSMSGLFYQLFEFEPFKHALDIDYANTYKGARVLSNLSILSTIFAKFDLLENFQVFTKSNIKSAPRVFFGRTLQYAYINGVSEYEDEAEYAPSGCVSFMTIHQSKGMEFPVVIVGSLDSDPYEKDDEIKESLESRYYHRPPFEPYSDIKYYDFWRLYYTAFSRAQNLLVLTCGRYKSGRSYKAPSRCFAELYKKLPSWTASDFSKIEFDGIKPVNLKESYSFTSHISVYETCPRQYRFHKNLGFARKRIGATLFGSLVHETIEDVHRYALRHEEDMITDSNIDSWLDANYAALSRKEHAYLGAGQIEAARKQVKRYVSSIKNGTVFSDRCSGENSSPWSFIQAAEIDVSLVKPGYILKGAIDCIRGEGDTIEIVDFKSEKKPKNFTEGFSNRYKRQLEVYAHIIEERTGKKVSRMHLYYTAEETDPLVTFEKSEDAIDRTAAEFDDIVGKIQRCEFSSKAKEKKYCYDCDFRHYCGV